MLKVALPKGRLGNNVYKKFQAIGLGAPDLSDDSRKLIFICPEKDVGYLLVKPSDVAVYVERGACDIGVVGKDTLLEGGYDVYELLDLEIGKCRMAVAGLKDFTEDKSAPLKVATKYPNVARRYYASMSRAIDIIKLNGSIEIAPVIGLSDVIVDLVETGTTLKENNLIVYDTVFESSARLIANKSSYQFKRGLIDEITKGLKND